MPSSQVRKLGPERLRIPQTRGTALVNRAELFGFTFVMALLGCLLILEPRHEHGSEGGWLILTFYVVFVAAHWWASRVPLLTVHDGGIAVMNGREIHALRWDEARIGFAMSVDHRLLIRPIGGTSARLLIAVDIPPQLVDAMAEALPKSEASASAPILPTQPRAMT